MKTLSIIFLLLFAASANTISQVPYTNAHWGFEVEMIGEPQETFYEDGFHLFMERRTADRSKYLTCEIDVFKFDEVIENTLAFSDSLLAMEFLAQNDEQGNLSLAKRDDIERDSIPGILANIKIDFGQKNILNIVYMSFCVENIYYVIMYGSPTQTFEAIEEHAESFRFIQDK